MAAMMVRVIFCANKCQMLFNSQEYLYTHVTFIRIRFSLLSNSCILSDADKHNNFDTENEHSSLTGCIGRAFAIKASSGNILWSTPIAGEIKCSIAGLKINIITPFVCHLNCMNCKL